MFSVPLAESSSASADASGIARVKLGPLRAFESWDVKLTSVASTSSVKVPTVRVYRGAESPSRLIDGTYTGTLNSTDTPYTLRSGEKVVVVFEKCDVGATCTITVEGESKR